MERMTTVEWLPARVKSMGYRESPRQATASPEAPREMSVERDFHVATTVSRADPGVVEAIMRTACVKVDILQDLAGVMALLLAVPP